MTARRNERALARAAQQFNANRGEQRDRIRRGVLGPAARLDLKAAAALAKIGSVGVVSQRALERMLSDAA